MKKQIFLLLISCCYLVTSFAQRQRPTSKYAFGIALELGHSFPHFDRVQEKWKAIFYPAGGMTISASTRLNEHWMANVGLGLTAYILTNKGPVDRYIFDFASPHLMSGIAYSMRTGLNGQEHFFRLQGGVQLGYNGEFIDEFETYKVTIRSRDRFYAFVRPEVGIRRQLKWRAKGTPFRLGYELGTFYRYNLNGLGTAHIQDIDAFEVILRPKGDIIGVYFKVLVPTGRKKVQKQKQLNDRYPPIIYNPRFL